MNKNNSRKNISRLILLSLISFIFVSFFINFSLLHAATEVTVNYGYVLNKAKDLASKPYSLPTVINNNLTEEQYNQISYIASRDIWCQDKLPFRLEFFHLGWIFNNPININEFLGNYAQEYRFTNDLFSFGNLTGNVLNKVKSLNGYSGYKILYCLNNKNRFDEVISMLGNKYYRALGENNTYGAGAYSFLIINEKGELEIPYFKEIWMGKPNKHDKTVLFFALAECKSAVAVLQYRVEPGKITVIDVNSTIFFRNDVKSVGIAPLISMYVNGKLIQGDGNKHKQSISGVHNSDGVQLLDGDWGVWMPMQNSKTKVTYSYRHGFSSAGFYQRNRGDDTNPTFAKVPNVWFYPTNTWGNGSIIVENTDHEKNSNNLLLYWKSDKGYAKGANESFNYKINWSLDEPNNKIGKVISSDIVRNSEKGIVKFTVYFDSDVLRALPPQTKLKPIFKISPSSDGVAEKIKVAKDKQSNRWYATFALKMDKEKDSVNHKPIQIKLAIGDGRNELTEIWDYKWIK